MGPDYCGEGCGCFAYCLSSPPRHTESKQASDEVVGEKTMSVGVKTTTITIAHSVTDDRLRHAVRAGLSLLAL